MRKSLLALSIAALIGGAANAQVISNVGSAVPGAAPATALESDDHRRGPHPGRALLHDPGYEQDPAEHRQHRHRERQGCQAALPRRLQLGRRVRHHRIPVTRRRADGRDVAAAEDGSGVSRLVTNDTSCTLPYKQDIKDQGGKFKTNRKRRQGPDPRRLHRDPELG